MVSKKIYPRHRQVSCTIPVSVYEGLLKACVQGGYGKTNGYRLAVMWAVSDPAFMIALEEGQFAKVLKYGGKFFAQRETYLTNQLKARFYDDDSPPTPQEK